MDLIQIVVCFAAILLVVIWVEGRAEYRRRERKEPKQWWDRGK